MNQADEDQELARRVVRAMAAQEAGRVIRLSRNELAEWMSQGHPVPPTWETLGYNVEMVG